MSAAVHASDFEPVVGQTVVVTGPWTPEGSDDHPVADGLVDPEGGGRAEDGGLHVPLEVVRIDVHDHPGPFEQFSLRLCGPRALALGQGTYAVDHPDLPVRTLFLVPRRETDDLRLYDAPMSVPRADERTGR